MKAKLLNKTGIFQNGRRVNMSKDDWTPNDQLPEVIRDSIANGNYDKAVIARAKDLEICKANVDQAEFLTDLFDDIKDDLDKQISSLQLLKLKRALAYTIKVHLEA